jgi:hypothetical protein
MLKNIILPGSFHRRISLIHWLGQSLSKPGKAVILKANKFCPWHQKAGTFYVLR